MLQMPRCVWFVVYYVAWVGAHFVATHAYTNYCAPHTVWGFVRSPFIASTPHCEGLRWIISTGGSNMTTMWTLFGVWITTCITEKVAAM